jgi:DNA primase
MIDFISREFLGSTLGLKHIKETPEGYSASCPFKRFHSNGEDKHPSFNIKKDTGVWHCFTCDQSGNLNKLFIEVLGEVPEEYKDFYKRTDPNSEKLKVRLNKAASVHVNIISLPKEYTLELSEEAQIYVRETRGVTKSAINYFQIGYCKGGQYLDCIVIPIFFEKILRSFIARKIGEELLPHQRRYMLASGTPKKELLFNYDRIDGDKVYIVEGVFDVLRLFSLGTLNVCGLLGSTISEIQIQKLLQKGVKKVCVMLDGDVAGRSASKVVCEKLCAYFETSRILLAQGKDPGSIKDMQELDFLLRLEKEYILPVSASSH